MKHKPFNLFFLITVLSTVLFFSCGKNETKTNSVNGEYFDLKKFFEEEIKKLSASNPGIIKNFSEGEEVKTERLQIRDWAQELASFTELDMYSKNNTGFKKAIDSSGSLMKVNFEASDSNQWIEFVSVSYNKNKIELIEINTQKKSWIVDRKVHYSYQPGRGYSISNYEDYIWSSPKRQDLFIQINNPDDLEH